MVAVYELSNPKGYYTVVMLSPAGKLIATIAGPFKGDREANRAAQAERERMERAGQGNRRRRNRQD